MTSCPGNRRWVQLMFDAFLLMPTGPVSMVDARNAMLAADMIRFGGVNQDILWNAFANRGLGEGAVSNGAGDVDPMPSFNSPFAERGDRDVPAGRRGRRGAAGASCSSASTRPERCRSPTPTRRRRSPTGSSWCRGRTADRAGYGLRPRAGHACRCNAGQMRDLQVKMRENLASSRHGATASGDGINLAALIDDNEATNWASLGSPVAGKQVTVGSTRRARAVTVRRVQVSAQLRPALAGDRRRRRAGPVLGAAPVPDPGLRGERERSTAPGRALPRPSSRARRTRSRRSCRGHVRRS